MAKRGSEEWRKNVAAGKRKACRKRIEVAKSVDEYREEVEEEVRETAVRIDFDDIVSPFQRMTRPFAPVDG